MTRKTQIFCGISGIVSIVLMMVGMGPIGMLMPPPPATITAAEISAHVAANALGIELGMFMVNIGVALSIALVVGISIEMRRIEAPGAPVLSYIQLMTGTVASLFLMLPTMIMSVAAFRPERSPETILLLHDLASFCTYIPFSVATLEALSITVIAFADKSPKPVFPRWLGVFSLLAGLTYVPMGLIGLFKTGIFASDGFLGWWLPSTLVAPWYLLMGGFLIARGGRS